MDNKSEVKLSVLTALSVLKALALHAKSIPEWHPEGGEYIQADGVPSIKVFIAPTRSIIGNLTHPNNWLIKPEIVSKVADMSLAWAVSEGKDLGEVLPNKGHQYCESSTNQEHLTLVYHLIEKLEKEKESCITKQ